MANGAADAPELRDIDASVPHSARIWNYWLGGKDNFAADRAAGDEFLAVYPGHRDKARAVRHFLARTVRYLVVEAGVRQFLDVGTGLPTADNTHEVAQRLAPESQIVYVDNDPLVLAHAQAPAHQLARGRHRLHRRGPARPREHPRRGREDARPRPARGADAHRRARARRGLPARPAASSGA